MITLEELHEAMEYYGIDCIKRTDLTPVKEGIIRPESTTTNHVDYKRIYEAQYDINFLKKKYGRDVIRAAAEELFGKR